MHALKISVHSFWRYIKVVLKNKIEVVYIPNCHKIIMTLVIILYRKSMTSVAYIPIQCPSYENQCTVWLSTEARWWQSVVKVHLVYRSLHFGGTSCLCIHCRSDHSSILKMEETRFSKCTYLHTKHEWNHIPTIHIFTIHCYNNLKSQILFLILEKTDLVRFHLQYMYIIRT